MYRCTDVRQNVSVVVFAQQRVLRSAQSVMKSRNQHAAKLLVILMITTATATSTRRKVKYGNESDSDESDNFEEESDAFEEESDSFEEDDGPENSEERVLMMEIY